MKWHFPFARGINWIRRRGKRMRQRSCCCCKCKGNHPQGRQKAEGRGRCAHKGATTDVRPGKISSNNSQRGDREGTEGVAHTRVCVCVCVCRSSCPRVNLQHNLLIWFLCQLQSENWKQPPTGRATRQTKCTLSRARAAQRSSGRGSGSGSAAGSGSGWQFMKNSLVPCVRGQRGQRIGQRCQWDDIWS